MSSSCPVCDHEHQGTIEYLLPELREERIIVIIQPIWNQ